MKNLSGIRALVVDDDPDLREVLADTLNNRGCKTFEAENGIIAFDLVKTHNLDIVVTDIRMPGGDGIELLEKIKGFNAESPVVIMMTGFAGITPNKMRERGAFTVLPKPFTQEVFLDAIATALKSRLKS